MNRVRVVLPLAAMLVYGRYRPESGHIWVASYTAGFQILQLTESAGPTAPRPTGP